MEAEERRKRLQSEVSRLERSIKEAPVSKTQFLESFEETKSFLCDKSQEFSENSEPVEISGVFPADIEIIRTVRASSKFLSPEEEAEARRKEILGLKQAAELAATAASPMLESVIIPEVGANSVLTDTEQVAVGAEQQKIVRERVGEGLNLNTPIVGVGEGIECNQNAIEMGVRVGMESSGSVRKRGVLAGVNPDVLSKLNKMFMSPNGAAQTSQAGQGQGSLSKRIFGSRVSPKVADGTSTPNAPSISTPGMAHDRETPKSKKSVKSKFLKRYTSQEQEFAQGVALAESTVDVTPTAAKPQLSFLDQIKSRGTTPKLTSPAGAQQALATPSTLMAAIVSEISTPPLPPVPPTNATPVAVAKGMGGGKNGLTSPPMSFLDAIKARRRDD